MTTDVPGDGPVQLGAVRLPAGRRLSRWGDAAPRLWATSEPVPDAGRVWRALADMRQDTGLVPILLAFLHRGQEGRPWDTGEFEDRCDLAAVDRLDGATAIAQEWACCVPGSGSGEFDPGLAEELAPFGMRFPGLTPGQDRALTEAELDRALDWCGAARIGLVPAARPADVLAHLGFNGNRYGAVPEVLPAALRSWEDRFGAVLLEVGFAHIRLLARRPPRTLPEAQAVAAELWACCDEFWPADKPGIAARGVRGIAEHILDIPIWSLWLG